MRGAGCRGVGGRALHDRRRRLHGRARRTTAAPTTSSATAPTTRAARSSPPATASSCRSARPRLVDIHLTHRAFMYLAVILVTSLVVVAIRRGVLTRWAWGLAALLVAADPRRRAERLARRIRAHDRAAPRARHAAVGRDARADAPARPRARARAAARRGGGRLMEALLGARSAWRTVVSDYFEMTKPKVQSLLLFTTVTTMYVAGDPSLGLVALTCLGGALSAGGAGRDQPRARPRHRPRHAAHGEPARWRRGASRRPPGSRSASGWARRRSCCWRRPSTCSPRCSRCPACSATCSSTRSG